MNQPTGTTIKTSPTITYFTEHPRPSMIGQKFSGYLCESLKWTQENGSAEIWVYGQWDKGIYPELQESPFGLKPTGTEARVCSDIAARQQVGIKKYGVTVEGNPLSLRDWLQHAYEETLDQAVYLKRAIEEIESDNDQPTSLRGAASKTPGSTARIYQSDALCICRHIDELKDDLAKAREELAQLKK